MNKNYYELEIKGARNFKFTLNIYIYSETFIKIYFRSLDTIIDKYS